MSTHQTHVKQSRRLHTWSSWLILASLAVGPAFGATITVTNTNDSGSGSLRDAITSASPGDTIVFGVTGTITLASPLGIPKSLTISGPGASSLAISGNNAVRVFEVGPGFTVTISGVTVRNGNTTGEFYGGAILNWGTLTLDHIVATGNFGSQGAILTIGQLTLTNSTLSGNTAFYYGGGIESCCSGPSTTVTVRNSTISGNTANVFGGGIYNGGTTMTVINSTIAGNSSGLDGGAIWNGGALTLIFSTIWGNSGAYSPGIFNTPGASLTMKNVILDANNTGLNCVGGAVSSMGHNLSDDSSCSLSGPGDLNNTPSGLDPGGLQNNGGPTQTVAPLSTSLAVDAVPLSNCTDVSGAPVSTDQRGIARPQGAACDIGSVDVAGDTLGPVTSNLTATPSPAPVNSGVTLTATVDDSTTRGNNIASAEYSISGGAFTGSFSPMSGSFNSSPVVNVTASLPSFPTSDLYTLCSRGTDAAGNVGATTCVLLPVYDPSAGFVTGGGTIHSTAGADYENASASGPASFGFVSKYHKGATTPSGNLEFQFRAGNLNFKSTSIDWLVVTGQPRAQFQGTGTINGGSVCKFQVDAWDRSFQPGSVDAFGLKIFACNSGGDANGNRYTIAATTLMNGSIIIH